MILGIGADIVDARRIQAAMDRHPDKFAKRIFSDAEITAAKESINQASYFAKRFAVKEAVYKVSSAVLQRPVKLTIGAPFGADRVSASRHPQPGTPELLSAL